MLVSLIAAIADNGVIGRAQSMPWDIPEDLQWFKHTTMGKPIIMGRKTYESIGRPLPGRHNILITRQADWIERAGVTVCSSLSNAIEQAGYLGHLEEISEVVVIGGGVIYKEALPIVDKMYLTHIHAKPKGDVYFPEINWDQWYQTSEIPCPENHGGSSDFKFCIYQRIG